MTGARSSRRWSHRTRSAGIAAGAVGALAFLMCDADRSIPAIGSAPLVHAPSASDSLSIHRVLEAVRGASPVLCELAALGLDRGWGDVEPSLTLLEIHEPGLGETLRDVLESERDTDAVRVLGTGLADSDRCVSTIAATLLGRSRAREALTLLRAALEADAPALREVAARGLAQAGSPQAIPDLVPALEDPSPAVRAAAAWALGEIE